MTEGNRQERLILTTTAALIIIFLAAIVRGYSGFGFSLIAITGLALLYPVSTVVPAIFLMKIAATLHMLPSIWKDIHWRSLLPLILGCLVATPFGLMALAYVAPEHMQVALSVFVLAAVALMFKGFKLNAAPGTAAAIAAGGSAGFCNGAFGIAGPTVILFYFSSPAGNTVGRASIAASSFYRRHRSELCHTHGLAFRGYTLARCLVSSCAARRCLGGFARFQVS